MQARKTIPYIKRGRKVLFPTAEIEVLTARRLRAYQRVSSQRIAERVRDRSALSTDQR